MNQSEVEHLYMMISQDAMRDAMADEHENAD